MPSGGIQRLVPALLPYRGAHLGRYWGAGSLVRAEGRMIVRSKPQAGEHSTSAWALMAALLLLVMGLALLVGAFWLLIEGLRHGGGSGGVREAMLLFGAVVLGAGIAHVYAAILIWAHRSAGRTLGIIIGATGTLLGAAVVWFGFSGSLNRSDLALFLYPLPHLSVLIGLLAGRRHFPASSGPEGPASWGM